MSDIKIGDTVRTGVYVCGEWQPMSKGVVVSQSMDGSISHVDIMSLHGGRPWIQPERTDHLRKVSTPAASGIGESGGEG